MSEALVNVTIFDTTLRDGAQSLPDHNQFPYGEKPEIAGHIANLGIGVIEAGFPRTPGDADEVRLVSKSIGNTEYTVSSWKNGETEPDINVIPVIAGLCRTSFEDIDVTWQAVESAVYPRIHTFVSTDKEHMEAKFSGKTPEEVHKMGKLAVRHARSLMGDRPKATVEFSAEAASTTDEGYLERVVKSAIDEGADIINLPDTVGQRDPFWTREFYAKAIKWITELNPNVAISAHNHNDLDMSTANTMSLVSAAANFAAIMDSKINVQLETAICGLGERAGNADVFPVVASLFKFAEQMPADITWRFNPQRSAEVARTVMGFASLKVHRQNPIVGDDVKTHRSGIHSDGVIKGGHRIYTPYDPTFWGHKVDAEHEEGRYQGRRGRAAIAGQNS